MAKHWKNGRFSNQEWDQKIFVEVTTLDRLIKIYGLPNYIRMTIGTQSDMRKTVKISNKFNV